MGSSDVKGSCGKVLCISYAATEFVFFITRVFVNGFLSLYVLVFLFCEPESSVNCFCHLVGSPWTQNAIGSVQNLVLGRRRGA